MPLFPCHGENDNSRLRPMYYHQSRHQLFILPFRNPSFPFFSHPGGSWLISNMVPPPVRTLSCRAHLKYSLTIPNRRQLCQVPCKTKTTNRPDIPSIVLFAGDIVIRRPTLLVLVVVSFVSSVGNGLTMSAYAGDVLK